MQTVHGLVFLTNFIEDTYFSCAKMQSRYIQLSIMVDFPIDTLINIRGRVKVSKGIQFGRSSLQTNCSQAFDYGPERRLRGKNCATLHSL